jgi:hypothetical protein
MKRYIGLLLIGVAAGVAGTMFWPALMQQKPGAISTPSVEQRNRQNPSMSRQFVVDELARRGYSCRRAINQAPDGSVNDIITCRNTIRGNSETVNTFSYYLGDAPNGDKISLEMSAFLNQGDLERAYQSAVKAALQ